MLYNQGFPPVNDENINERMGLKTRLWGAVFNRDIGSVEQLLELGAHVDTGSLCAASFFNYVNILRVLLRYPVSTVINKHQYYSYGGYQQHILESEFYRYRIYTPLDFALRVSNYECARMLIARGAKLDIVELDRFLPSIPGCIKDFVTKREQCRSHALLILSLKQCSSIRSINDNDKYVLQIIAKYVWSNQEYVDDKKRRKIKL